MYAEKVCASETCIQHSKLLNEITFRSESTPNKTCTEKNKSSYVRIQVLLFHQKDHAEKASKKNNPSIC